MAIVRNHARWKTNPITTAPYLDLVAAMFRLALHEVGEGWLCGPCGWWWLVVAGLDFGVVFRGLMRRLPTDEERVPLAECPGCDADWS